MRTFNLFAGPALGLVSLAGALASAPAALASSADSEYSRTIKPLLTEYCFDCHADGMDKGGVAFDTFKTDAELVNQSDLWLKALKNVRAGLMPPPKKAQPTAEEREILDRWIKHTAFGIDPANPDPGRVTLRRLNRVEYKNTIRELMGIEFNVDDEFPPDDTGYGFDTIADVLTVSPLLLEKYMVSAEKIVARATPVIARVTPEKVFSGNEFRASERGVTGERLDFYNPATVSRKVRLDHAGDYEVALELRVNGSFDFDPGKADVLLRKGDEQIWAESFAWQDGKLFTYTLPQKLEAGEHEFTFELKPLVEATNSNRRTSVALRVQALKVRGPLEAKFLAPPPNYTRFFTRSEPPADAEERREYAAEVLRQFATKAFRRPVDDRTVEQLVAIAEDFYSQPGKRFEEGVARAFVATLSSPKFIFRIEEAAPGSEGQLIAPIDEYALASRLSYFLWSSMPDEELFDLAKKNELRKNLAAQVKRMLDDSRSGALVDNFTGQWLQARDVDSININIRALRGGAGRGAPRGAGRAPGIELDRQLRNAMQREVAMFFGHVLKEDRSVLDFLDSDYTFVNEKLAALYEIPDIEGQQMRKVQLSEESPRGGLLTSGAVLMVTSNPTRTSPVKRGLFLLANVLGTPTPPAPPDVPELEEAAKEFKDKDPTLRETLELHRSNTLCSSCHNRMDPLGLAMENFNALGQWRDQERGVDIDPSGELITGEKFANVRELKKILKESRQVDFYRCLTEKLMTYALGRGLEPHDVEAVDRIVSRLQAENGRMSVLVNGVIESAPFQKRRNGQRLTAANE